MKFITTRGEIAQAINIRGITVLTVDVSKCMDGYPDCYIGSKVRILGGHSDKYSDLYTCCTVKMFGDEQGNEDHEHPWFYKKIILSGNNVCIKSDFGLLDVDRMVEWSNTKIVRPNESILVYFRGKDRGYLRSMKIDDKISPNCSTVARLIDAEN